MGRGFGGDPDAPLARFGHGPDGAPDAQMGDVDARPGGLGQADVPDDHDLLGGGRHAPESETAGRRALVHRRPPRLRFGSSQWSMTSAPRSRELSRACRMMSAFPDRAAVVGERDGAGAGRGRPSPTVCRP